MGWFSSNDNDAIRSQIRDLENDLRYLEREASNARDQSSRYLDKHKDIMRENNYCDTWESRDALQESNYWGNVNADTQCKIDALEDKIRDLEREL